MPPPELPPSVLAVLGLALSGCPEGDAKACLNLATTTPSTGDTGEPPATETAPPTGDAALLERLAADDVLPADVLERLRRRGD